MNIIYSSKDYMVGLAAALLLAFGFVSASSARDVTVGVANGDALSFFPAVTNIATGDRVIWIWNNISNLHSTTDTGLWDSVLQASPYSFTNTFNTAGNFPYFCSRHVSFGMTGEVLVAGANQPPTINVTNPAPGAVFSAPANVTIQASASDSDGSVTNVQFLIGSTVLANKTAAPFFAVTNNLAAGSYTLSAIVSDNLGAKATNSVNIVVDAPPIVTITNPATGIVLSAPASLTLKVSATDSAGGVTNVQFWQGTILLGDVAAAPFAFGVNNLAAANYTFLAIASDNHGLTATNSILVSVINPSPVTIGAPEVPSPNHFQFSYASDIGLSYVVQVSTNLLSGWTPVATNTATANPTIYTNANASGGSSFYRVGLLPNP